MSTTTISVDAILFDMDGTLIDSTPGVLQAWKTFSADYNLGDSTAIAHATHGRRLYDTLKEYCGINDEDRLLEEIDRFEDAVIEGGPAALVGAIELVSKVSRIPASHPSSSSKWTIVTSASNKYAPRALERSGVPLPSLGLITSNDVTQGKPHPAPYLAGASRCEVDPKKCLVIEDAISGLKAGRAAGSLTLAVCTSTARSVIAESDAKPHLSHQRIRENVAMDYIVNEIGTMCCHW
ncbi:HAD-like domain-containing protein [Flammula alnicola]|nr:HAD-like domain-containing protein [Flammula alnicola]